MIDNSSVHQGNNIRQIRELVGLRQQQLAERLGSNWNQQKVSLLEKKQKIKPHILQTVSSALDISVEFIQYFDSRYARQLLKCGSRNGYMQQQTSFLLQKIIELYEKLLESEREKYRITQYLESL
ncbi:helix-turn-helix domain-containing protein [Chitinophaga sp. 30R24]|uniref:helix-turn-helix domain-containing protein n=1 Tax=Chitinophaga sp. 30R24 TaxID=3248838 RepID=UPI003B915B74